MDGRLTLPVVTNSDSHSLFCHRRIYLCLSLLLVVIITCNDNSNNELLSINADDDRPVFIVIM